VGGGGDDAKFAMMENQNYIASANFGENGILIFEKKILEEDPYGILLLKRR